MTGDDSPPPLKKSRPRGRGFSLTLGPTAPENKRTRAIEQATHEIQGLWDNVAYPISAKPLDFVRGLFFPATRPPDRSILDKKSPPWSGQWKPRAKFGKLQFSQIHMADFVFSFSPVARRETKNKV